MDKAQKEQLRFLKMIKNECGEQLNLISDYHKYKDDFYSKHKESINDLETKILENVKESEKLLEGFNLVKFTDRDGKLVLCFDRGEKTVTFGISSLDDIEKDISENKETIKMLNKFCRNYKTELFKVVKIEQAIVEEIKNLKKDEPKKIFGFIVTPSEKEKIQRRFDRRLRDLKGKLSSVTGTKSSIIYNLEILENQISDYEATNEFLSKLTPEQVEQIKSKYAEINKLYQKNEKHYKKLELIEEQKLKLSEFVAKKTNHEAKWALLPLLKLLAMLYKQIPEEERNSNISSLTTAIDFGEYKPLIDTILEAMVNQEFGSISRAALKRYGDDYEKNISQEKLK